jgi:putative transcriptional regulator
VAAPVSDGEGGFGKDRLEPAVGLGVVSEFVVASAQVLHERVSTTPPSERSGSVSARAKAVRFSTLAALCEVLKCQPGDLLRWEAEEAADEWPTARRTGGISTT